MHTDQPVILDPPIKPLATLRQRRKRQPLISEVKKIVSRPPYSFEDLAKAR